jgi:transposase
VTLPQLLEAQDRIKTDQRDAQRLVRLLMIGGLHAVRVPSCEEEALRDLVTLV